MNRAEHRAKAEQLRLGPTAPLTRAESMGQWHTRFEWHASGPYGRIAKFSWSCRCTLSGFAVVRTRHERHSSAAADRTR